jgi:hypothetical protein
MGLEIKNLSSFLTFYPRLAEKMDCGIILD